MSAQDIQKKMEEFHYWDSRLEKLTCSYFGDEVELIYEEGDLKNEYVVNYMFRGCFDVRIHHLYPYPKIAPSKDLKRGEIPYFIQDIKVEDFDPGNSLRLYKVKMNIYPMEVEIIFSTVDMKKYQRTRIE